jgi:hypothetical protein
MQMQMAMTTTTTTHGMAIQHNKCEKEYEFAKKSKIGKISYCLNKDEEKKRFISEKQIKKCNVRLHTNGCASFHNKQIIL